MRFYITHLPSIVPRDGSMILISPPREQTMSAAGQRRTERMQIYLRADDLPMVDEFRYMARMPSWATAVRELLRRGLGRVLIKRHVRSHSKSSAFSTASVTSGQFIDALCEGPGTQLAGRDTVEHSLLARKQSILL